MKMKSYLTNVYKILTQDETLLRLLYYKPSSPFDDPLDTNKSNVLDLPEDELWEFIEDRIKFTPTTEGLDSENICRIFFYPSTRSPRNQSYRTADQYINVDIHVHRDFNDKDMRLAWICDHLNDLLFDEKVSNLGKVRLQNAKEMTELVKGYLAYSFTYEVGSVN